MEVEGFAANNQLDRSKALVTLILNPERITRNDDSFIDGTRVGALP